jgi:tetratricopeptide (TPR) repeat protein
MRYHFILLCAIAWQAAAADAGSDLFEQSRRWLQEGELIRARDGFGSAWKLFTKERGNRDQRTIETQIFYGQLLALTDNPQKAYTVLGPICQGTDRTSLVARSAFALALRQDGQHKRSVKMLEELLRIFPRASGDDLSIAGRLQSELGTSYSYLRKYSKSVAAATEGVRLLDAAGPQFRIYRPASLIVLGNSQLLAGQNAEAAVTLNEARNCVLPHARREIALLEGGLAVVALRTGRLEEAERRTRVSLALLTELFGPEHSEVAATSQQLAAVLHRQDRKKEARAIEARAREILNRRNTPPTAVSAWGWRGLK